MMEHSEISKIFDEVRQEQDTNAETFWNNLSYEDQCNAFHAVVKRICKAEIEDQGSYRHALYGVFGFDFDMYVRGMNCGYMALHNSIMNDEQFNEAMKEDE